MVLLKSKPSLMNESIIPQSFNSFLNEFLHDSKSFQESFGEQVQFSPKADILEKANHFEIHLALPGMKKEDVKINVEGDFLTVSGEKQSTTVAETEKLHKREIHFGKFSRSFNVSKINKAKIEAQFDNGILTLTLPKVEAALPLSIDIK
jgi:HSP20 family protein